MNTFNNIGKFSQEKHKKYENEYRSDVLYWGLGIENELYLELTKGIQFSREKFLKNHRRERYSVDYFSNYKSGLVANYLKNIDYNCNLPLLVNSHSFNKTDRFNNPRTLYTKNCEFNNKFEGKVLWNFIEENNEYLKTNYNNNFMFDGDTIELITVNFFNNTLDNIIDELKETKTKFIENVQDVFEKNNIFTEYGKIDYMTDNHPFAVHMTNNDNMSMFNNGTLHFNITLPTKLDMNGKIENKQKFVNDHKNYIRFVQVLEPILLAVFGSPDPFSNDPKQQLKFSACSQRNAVSRYISVGTYNTDEMIPGKVLTEDISKIKVAIESFGWIKQYYDYCGYNKLDYIGYDINFNKHYNHGVEVRFFDHISDIEKIKEVFKVLIYLGDFSLENWMEENPILSPIWNDIVISCMNFGKKAELSDNHIIFLKKIFKYDFISTSVTGLYYEILYFLESKFKNIGNFSRYALGNPVLDAEEKAKNILINAEEKAKDIIANALDIEQKSQKIKDEAELLANRLIAEAEATARRFIQLDNAKKKTIYGSTSCKEKLYEIKYSFEKEIKNIGDKKKSKSKCCSIL